MHRCHSLSLNSQVNMIFQFPLLGISPCTKQPHYTILIVPNLPFNSLYLGFLHAPNFRRGELRSTYNLSIPFTWDFSMHHGTIGAGIGHHTYFFQFPLLGISPCTGRRWRFTFTKWVAPFNSLYLGFLHAPQISRFSPRFTEFNFQFPLLGISPCTHPVWRLRLC